jgi:serine/threonine protein kinase
MATNGDGTGRSANPRQQIPSTVAPAAGPGSQPGAETVPAGGPAAALPEQFGPYRVKKKLGGGGMGAVYLVENTALKREEALKVPHFDSGDDPSVRQRFVQEAQAAAALKHPNLCPVYHVGEQNGIHFLTMPYLEGKPLSDFTGRPQPPRKAVEVVAKLAQALAAAHARGVIHRDLKPNNVMMCAGLGPVVMDFGLSRQVRGQDQRLTQSGTALGTPAYMPPEQIRGEIERMGPASDVYSLGVILFELLTGRQPFQGGSMGDIFGKTLYTEAPAPSSVRPGLSPALDAVCRQALAKEPEQRYPTMKAFAAALVDYLRATPPEEGAGNLVPSKAGVAKILEAPTVPPSQAPVSPGKARPGATRAGGKAPSSVRRPAGPPGGAPEATLIAAPKEQGGGWPWGLILGCAACAVLVLVLVLGGGALFLLNRGPKAESASGSRQGTRQGDGPQKSGAADQGADGGGSPWAAGKVPANLRTTVELMDYEVAGSRMDGRVWEITVKATSRKGKQRFSFRDLKVRTDEGKTYEAPSGVMPGFQGVAEGEPVLIKMTMINLPPGVKKLARVELRGDGSGIGPHEAVVFLNVPVEPDRAEGGQRAPANLRTTVGFVDYEVADSRMDGRVWEITVKATSRKGRQATFFRDLLVKTEDGKTYEAPSSSLMRPGLRLAEGEPVPITMTMSTLPPGVKKLARVELRGDGSGIGPHEPVVFLDVPVEPDRGEGGSPAGKK